MIEIQRKTARSALIPAIVLLGATLLLTGCLQKPAQKPAVAGLTPKQALVKAMEKKGNISSYKATGQTKTTITGVKTKSVTGDVAVYVSGEKKRTDTTVAMTGIEKSVRIYDLPEGLYQCQKIGNWTCVEIQTTSKLTGPGATSAEKLKNLIDKGAITLTQDTVKQKSVMGRTCNYIKMKVNPEALTGTETAAAGVIDKLNINQCFDTETGISLSSNAEMTMTFRGIKATIQTDTELDSLSVGVNIPDSKFELPG